MAMIRCTECKKPVSDKANTCPACGNPIGGGGAVADVAFENRIEQYKKAGYKFVKREGDSVNMICKFSKGKFFAIFFAPLLFVAVILFFFASQGNIGVLAIMVLPVLSIFAGLAFAYNWASTYRVTLSLTKTGKIEESGKVLKK